MEEPGRLKSMGSLRVGHDWTTSLSLFHFHALEKEMATHSSVLAWRISGAGEPGGLRSMGSHRIGHDWSDLAVAVAAHSTCLWVKLLALWGWHVMPLASSSTFSFLLWTADIYISIGIMRKSVFSLTRKELGQTLERTTLQEPREKWVSLALQTRERTSGWFHVSPLKLSDLKTTSCSNISSFRQEILAKEI